MTLLHTWTVVLVWNPRNWRLWGKAAYTDQWPRVYDYWFLCFFLRHEVSVP